jgi:type IV pilus assembly protein PilE
MHTTNPSNFSIGLGSPELARLRSCAGTRRCERGLTLIEMMMVVAIIAIIAAMVLPTYQQSVRTSRRADAVLALQQIQVAQERLRAECTSYAAELAAARFCNPGPGIPPGTPPIHTLAFLNRGPNGTGISDDGFYTLALSNVTAAGYTATASAVAGTSQAADTDTNTGIDCTVLTLQVAGPNLTRTPAGCWPR